MSRTYRRKSGKKHWWAGSDWKHDENGIFRRVEVGGKELKKALAYYHGDYDLGWSPAPWWRKDEWHKFRQQSKQELIRWLKNEDHEVQIRANPRWPWWD
jgi:hypothetical protein